MNLQINSFADYQTAYQHSVNDPEGFWGDIAAGFQWQKPWDKVVAWSFKDYAVSWFTNAKLNITENALDRHLENRGNQTAIIWEANNPAEESVSLTYSQLHQKVCNFANVLKQIGRAHV